MDDDIGPGKATSVHCVFAISFAHATRLEKMRGVTNTLQYFLCSL